MINDLTHNKYILTITLLNTKLNWKEASGIACRHFKFYLSSSVIQGLENTFEKRKWQSIRSTQKEECLILIVDDEKGIKEMKRRDGVEGLEEWQDFKSVKKEKAIQVEVAYRQE